MSRVWAGYRPKRTARDAIKRVAEAIVRQKTRVLDFDLRACFDNVRHDRLLAKVARRIDDADVMHLLKVMLKASGKKRVPQGGVISPLLSNLYLNVAILLAIVFPLLAVFAFVYPDRRPAR
jgi:RNA-directed DNA polymerase